MASCMWKFHDDTWALTDNFNEWNHNEFIQWIMNLDEDFYDKYESAFSNVELNGSYLVAMINVSYLQSMFKMNPNDAQQLSHVVQKRVQAYNLSLIPATVLGVTTSESKYNDDHLDVKIAQPDEELIECAVCGDKMSKSILYQCNYNECKGTKCGAISCKDCFNFIHKKLKRKHLLDLDKEIICINEMINSVKYNKNFKDGYGFKIDKWKQLEMMLSSDLQSLLGVNLIGLIGTAVVIAFGLSILGPFGIVLAIAGIMTCIPLMCKQLHDSDTIFEKKHQKALVAVWEDALQFFHLGRDLSIINDCSKFNTKIITKKYHAFALIYHPDRNPEKKEEDWLKLCRYYGILSALCDMINENNNENVPDDNETLLLN